MKEFIKVMFLFPVMLLVVVPLKLYGTTRDEYYEARYGRDTKVGKIVDRFMRWYVNEL